MINRPHHFKKGESPLKGGATLLIGRKLKLSRQEVSFFRVFGPSE